MEILSTAENIQIMLDSESHILYCRWFGPQQPGVIQESATTILRLIIRYKIERILNDNTDVTGPYLDSSDWMATHWFPEVMREGVTHFAWVLSRNIFAEISALEAMPKSEKVCPFKSTQEALLWLTDH